MNVINTLLLILAIIPAVSYAWGMRGTTIGGEKGAMLPGAIIGALLAYFSGILIVQENFYIFAALGAVGMYFGGCMTYGETLSFTVSARPAVNFKKGMLALIVKGFLWFASFGAIFSTGVNAVCGVYNLVELIVIFILTPTFALLGLKLLNRPHNAEQVIFPKIYFSKTRKEYWGALAGITASLLLINLHKLSSYVFIFTFICGFFGAIGWVLGQLIHIYINQYAHTSKIKFIKKLADNHTLDGWKGMECTLGAVGGLGCAVGFLLTYNKFKNIAFNLELNGGIKPLNETLSTVLLVVWLALLGVDMVHYFKKLPKIEPYFEVIEFILYAAVPFILITLGSSKAAAITAYFLLLWVMVQEVAFEMKYINQKYSLILKISLSGIGLIYLLICLISKNYSITPLLLLYTAVYEVLTLLWLVPEVIAKNAEMSKEIELNNKDVVIKNIKLFFTNKSTIITHTYFIFSVILTLIFIF